MTNVALTEARERAQQAQKQIEEAQAVMAEAVQGALTEGLAPIFEQYPFFGGISWTQYTPYFNDGDTCVFSSSFPYVSINSVTDIEEGTYGTYEEPGEDFGRFSEEKVYLTYPDTAPNPDYKPEYKECEAAVKEFVEALVGDNRRDWSTDTPTTFDQALQRAFGDHALVIVTRDGYTVDECSHD